jgi:MFS family permease
MSGGQDVVLHQCGAAGDAAARPPGGLDGRHRGRKPLLLLGLGILPLRAVLCTLSDDSAWLIGVQLLDGVGAGIFGALTPLVVADLMRGTGRYNVALGAVATMQGIGAATSGLVAGLIVDHFGYSAAFLTSGAAAAVALAALAFAMPETAPSIRQDSRCEENAGGQSLRAE